jgi:hypothetical protein
MNTIFRRLPAITAILLCFGLVSVCAQENQPAKGLPPEGQFKPIDEADQVPGFKAFRDKLLEAVDKQDLKFVLDHVDEQIKCGFGGDAGKANFIKIWNLDAKSGKSELWKTLKPVLELGGTWQKGGGKTFYAPCYFDREVPGNPDPFMMLFTIGENVRVREKPDVDAPVIDELNWEVVLTANSNDEKLVDQTINGETHTWEHITTPRGKSGYVFGKYLRSPIDYRGSFSPKKGTWVLDFLGSGD